MRQITAYTMIKDLHLVTEKHAKIFDRINLAFGKLKENKVDIIEKENLKYIKKLRKINENLQFVLSIGGARAFGFSDMAMQKETRDIFLDSMVETVKEYDLDGIDLDWEFPGHDWGGDFSPKDKQNFTILLKEMRERLDQISPDRKYLLTIAAAVGEWFIESTEMHLVHQYLDEIMLMTYDLRGFGQEITGHHTTLYAKKDDIFKTSNVEDGIKLLMNEGVPKEMISIGAAMYARSWHGVESENNGLLQKAAPNGGEILMEYPMLLDSVINNPDFENFFDDEAKVPWSYNKKDGIFVTYDNAESVAWKSKFVVENDLKGLMFWRYVDWPENDLIDAMKAELKD